MVALARERDVTFDVCPISNLKLGVYPSYADYPLRALMQAGVRCTVSTDDPLVFGNDLAGEYAALAAEGGFSVGELAQLVRNGWETALVPPAIRAAMGAEIDRQLGLAVP